MTVQCEYRQPSIDVRQYIVYDSEPFWTTLDIVVFVILLLVLLLQFSTVMIVIVIALIFLRRTQRQRQVQQESLTVIRELGVQLDTKYYSGKESHLFIEKTNIQSIIMNEGIKSFGFIFYMAFLVEGQQRMILAFQHLYPKLNVLLPIYRGTRAVMFGEPE